MSFVTTLNLGDLAAGEFKITGMTSNTTSVTETAHTIVKGVCWWTLLISQLSANDACCDGIVSMDLPFQVDPKLLGTIGEGILMTDREGVFHVMATTLDGRSAQFLLNPSGHFINPHKASPENNDKWILALNGAYRVV